MLQANKRVLFYTELSILNKKLQKLLGGGWFSFMGKIYQKKKPFKIFNSVILQYQSQ